MQFPLSRAVAPSLEWRDSCPSTNADLVRRAEGLGDLAVLATDDQTAGRGRLDRVWSAPPGASLAVSVFVALEGGAGDPASGGPRALLGWLPLLAGTAMATAARRLGVPSAGVKWPNDVLVDGRKLCGVLTELTPHGVVIGAGLNTAMTREQLPVLTATSLHLEGAALEGETPSELLDRALAAYLDELTGLIGEWRAATGPAALRARVEPLLQTAGRAVRVDRPGLPPLMGTADGLADDGSLRVHPAEGDALTVSAGDVTHLRYE
ncbi:biotin--[acetyl-CoA-carboxylase] ligase [Microcella flavibacter]|uniref:biotin--[acetyl-CoA-carboxylase] ligase n=1 Tax=Microcella flavibacter TaxID=1804990 RepID=UPI001456E5AA|nr:biotin--[acetyl-CoA-carboxylase] ligase [Microcella flavibacter]